MPISVNATSCAAVPSDGVTMQLSRGGTYGFAVASNGPKYSEERSFTAFSTVVPGTSNSVTARIGGDGCRGGLTIGTSASFTTHSNAAAHVSVVLRTTTVYADYRVLSIAFGLRDAEGRSRVVLPDSMSVSGVAVDSVASCSPSQIDAASGIGRCDVVVAASAFTAAGWTGNVTLSVVYAGQVAASGSVLVSFAPALGAVSLPSGAVGLLVHLPRSPRLPSEPFTVSVCLRRSWFCVVYSWLDASINVMVTTCTARVDVQYCYKRFSVD